LNFVLEAARNGCRRTPFRIQVPSQLVHGVAKKSHQQRAKSQSKSANNGGSAINSRGLRMNCANQGADQKATKEA
jgi:hypothetical protein